MEAIGVIPARYGSQRFPGKPLADLAGKPLVQHVWERAQEAGRLSRVIVATDDERILQAVRSFGGEAVMTRGNHPSGTDRVAEAVADRDVDIVVNIQGDEPLVETKIIDQLVAAFEADDSLKMATLAARVTDLSNQSDPNTAKVVVDKDGFALYFSRQPIPYVRDTISNQKWNGYLQHIGMYGFRKDFLLAFTSLEPSPLEKVEALEQLRALEHGFHVKVIEVDHQPFNVDTVEDLERVRAIIEKREIH